MTTVQAAIERLRSVDPRCSWFDESCGIWTTLSFDESVVRVRFQSGYAVMRLLFVGAGLLFGVPVSTMLCTQPNAKAKLAGGICAFATIIWTIEGARAIFQTRRAKMVLVRDRRHCYETADTYASSEMIALVVRENTERGLDDRACIQIYAIPNTGRGIIIHQRYRGREGWRAEIALAERIGDTIGLPVVIDRGNGFEPAGWTP